MADQSLRGRAIAAHQATLDEQRRKNEAAEKAEREAKADRLRFMLFDILGIVAEPDGDEWMHDGIVFHVGYDAYDFKWFLFISEACPHCDGVRVSYPIKSLTDLGAALSGGYWRSHEHYWAEDSPNAPAPPQVVAPPPTVDEQLVAVLRAFVEEYTPMGGSDA